MDIMHDILEGTLEYEVKELLKYLCSSGMCSLIAVNSKIQTFPYGYPKVNNKPSIITPDPIIYM